MASFYHIASLLTTDDNQHLTPFKSTLLKRLVNPGGRAELLDTVPVALRPKLQVFYTDLDAYNDTILPDKQDFQSHVQQLIVKHHMALTEVELFLSPAAIRLRTSRAEDRHTSRRLVYQAERAVQDKAASEFNAAIQRGRAAAATNPPDVQQLNAAFDRLAELTRLYH